MSLSIGVLAFLVYPGTALAQSKIVPTNNDCVKCHADQVNDITVSGGRHAGITCLNCHIGHPPAVKRPILPCSTCHPRSKNIHFTIETPACLGCHTNPHRPLNISLKDAGNDACRFCHGQESRLLRQYESKHTALNCSQCHDVHRKIPQCTQCHKPHAAEMIASDCNKCHKKAHTPKIVCFPTDMSSQVCGWCHKKPTDLLHGTTAKHKNLPCIGCHRLVHRFKPACQECHGTPHPEGILVKFTECCMCHSSPHDLNNWSETATEEAAGDTPKKK
jgi:hypothetical protein